MANVSSVSSLCVVPDCLVPGRHADGCPGEDCPGCVPGLAADGSCVCWHHERRTRAGLRDLADLWEALAERPHLTGVASMGSAGTDPAQPLGDERRRARSAIVAMLTAWCRTLAQPRAAGGNDITLPDERDIVTRTRRAVLDAQATAEECLSAYITARDAKDDQGHPDEHTRALAPGRLNEAQRHSQLAARLRNRRESGADVVEALADHLDRHAAWLLATVHADQFVHDVAAMLTYRGLAHAGRPAPKIRCSCGERVRIDPGDDEQIYECHGCGAWGVLAWWTQQEGLPEGEPLKLADLPDWLWQHHHLPVSYLQLRNWSRTRTIPGRHVDDCPRDDDCEGCARTAPAIRPIRGSDTGPGETWRYDPHAVALVALGRLTRTAAARRQTRRQTREETQSLAG
jgi:hypothetical protein